jgi:hypothetical protein
MMMAAPVPGEAFGGASAGPDRATWYVIGVAWTVAAHNNADARSSSDFFMDSSCALPHNKSDLATTKGALARHSQTYCFEIARGSRTERTRLQCDCQAFTLYSETV